MRIDRMKSMGVALCGLGLLWTGCADDDVKSKARLGVVLESEDTITQGLKPGTGAENIRDGWTVAFDRYLTVVGPIDLRSSTNQAVQVKDPKVHVVDLKQVPPGGVPLWNIEATQGNWEFRFETPAASAAGLVVHPTVPAEAAEKMRANNWTYHIQGKISKPDGQSCPPVTLATPGSKVTNAQSSGPNPCYAAPVVRFDIGAEADTDFGPCERDGIAGVALNSAQELTVAVTLHGDHLFFNGFPEGDEGGVVRLAQWLADCDLNLDGLVTNEELLKIHHSKLPEINERYQLGGSPISPLNNMYDFVRAQFKTQGHFQGEGECAVDGKVHDHGHGHHH